MLVVLSVVAEAGLVANPDWIGETPREVLRFRGKNSRRVGDRADQFTMRMRFWVHGRVFSMVR